MALDLKPYLNLLVKTTYLSCQGQFCYRPDTWKKTLKTNFRQEVASKGDILKGTFDIYV